MTILDKIITQKRGEIALRKATNDISGLEKLPFFHRACISLKENLLHSPTGIIAEFKRRSPSKGWINEKADAADVVCKYSKLGAAGISILTDEPFFGGTLQDLISVRSLVKQPILRKDFMVDEYQLFEAKAMGADVILLIAAALSIEQTKVLAEQAKALGLEVLLEIHNREEINHINQYVDMVGVNNRDLKTFEVNINRSKLLSASIPDEFIKISESGLSSPETIHELRLCGYKGFLIGESFMKSSEPAAALGEFIRLIHLKM